MTDKILNPILPLPPQEYDPDYMNQLVSVIMAYMRQNMEPGYIRGSTAALTQLSGNGGGLRVGDIFDDDGTLKIVRTSIDGTIDTFTGTTVGTGAVGEVTVAIS